MKKHGKNGHSKGKEKIKRRKTRQILTDQIQDNGNFPLVYCHVNELCWDAEVSYIFGLHVLIFENLWEEILNCMIKLIESKITKKNLFILPLVVSFFVLIILAANSRPVDFCTHLFTIENAPL